jgi:hypothetical protein
MMNQREVAIAQYGTKFSPYVGWSKFQKQFPHLNANTFMRITTRLKVMDEWRYIEIMDENDYELYKRQCAEQDELHRQQMIPFNRIPCTDADFAEYLRINNIYIEKCKSRVNIKSYYLIPNSKWWSSHCI